MGFRRMQKEQTKSSVKQKPVHKKSQKEWTKQSKTIKKYKKYYFNDVDA